MSNSYFVTKSNGEESYIEASGFNVNYKDGSLNLWLNDFEWEGQVAFFRHGDWKHITIHAPKPTETAMTEPVVIPMDDDDPEWDELLNKQREQLKWLKEKADSIPTLDSSDKSWDERNARWQEYLAASADVAKDEVYSYPKSTFRTYQEARDANAADPFWSQVDAREDKATKDAEAEGDELAEEDVEVDPLAEIKASLDVMNNNVKLLLSDWADRVEKSKADTQSFVDTMKNLFAK